MRPVRGRGGAHEGRSSRARSAAGFTCSPPRATPRGWQPQPNAAPRPSQLPVPGYPRDLPRCGTATSNSGARRPAANCPEHALCGPPAATPARKENKEPGGPWRPAREVRPSAPSFYPLQCFFFRPQNGTTSKRLLQSWFVWENLVREICTEQNKVDGSSSQSVHLRAEKFNCYLYRAI